MSNKTDNPLIRMYIKHSLIGFGIAAVFVVLLVAFNVANLGSLLVTSDIAWLAVGLLWFFHGIVFAAVQFSFAIMGMAEREDDDTPSGGLRQLTPIPVERDSRPRR